MKTRAIDQGWLVVVDRGEKLVESLAQVAREHKIGAAQITGVGALCQSRLGFFHCDQKKYDERLFEAEAELLSLVGNISWLGADPIVHVHVTLGDEEFRVFGGHLFEAEVAVTAEVQILTYETKVERQWNDSIGLNLQSL